LIKIFALVETSYQAAMISFLSQYIISLIL